MTNLTPFAHQVAGHKDTIFIGPDARFLHKATCKQEVEFYLNCPHELLTFIPKLHQIQPDFIIIENLVFGYARPCIMDLKMGKRLADPAYPDEKKARMQQVENNTTSGRVGVRICGMKMYRNDGLQQMDTKRGKELDVEQLREQLIQFLDGRKIKDALQKLLDTLHAHPNICSYSSSLLVYYDYDRAQHVECKWIDFAHTEIRQIQPTKANETSNPMNAKQTVEYNGMAEGLQWLISMLD